MSNKGPEDYLPSEAKIMAFRRAYRRGVHTAEVAKFIGESSCFTAMPVNPTKEVYAVDNLLCAFGVLHVFTNSRDFEAFADNLNMGSRPVGDFDVFVLNMAYAFSIARKNHMNLMVDSAINRVIIGYDAQMGDLRLFDCNA